MHWRSANKRKAMRPDREIEAHLGDIPDYLGDDPIRLPYRTHYDGPRWIETITATVMGFVACVSFAMLVVALLVMMFLYAPAKAADIAPQEKQVRRDCRSDAILRCPREALRCLAHEDDDCRAAVIACMLHNHDKLKLRCSRHLYLGNP